MNNGARRFLDLIILALLVLIIIFRQEVVTFLVNVFVYQRPDSSSVVITKNEYSTNQNYEFVQITDDFFAKDYHHLLNIMYTILDSGVSEFTFYCDDSYISCVNDVKYMIPKHNNTNTDLISEINNFVHPYNSYKYITITSNNYGEVHIEITKQYSQEMVNYVNSQIDTFMTNNIKEDTNQYDSIKMFHNYIINNTKYDSDRAIDVNNSMYANSMSHTAYGLFKDSVALCGGYSDAIAIYLNKIGVKNIKISSYQHVWNLLYLDDIWYNLDATWDDPVTSSGTELLIHEYFLIDTDTLLQKDTQKREHIYNTDIYVEAN